MAKRKNSFAFGIVNPNWLSLKAMYFFLFGGYAAFQPFIVLFFVSRGLTAAQISLIEFLNIIIGVVSRPILGSIADKTGKHKLALGLCILASAIPYFAMFFVPSTVGTSSQYQTLNCQSSEAMELTGCASAKFAVSNISVRHTVLLHENSSSQLMCSESKAQCSLLCANLSSWFGKNDDTSRLNYELFVEDVSGDNNCSSLVLMVDRKTFPSTSPACKVGHSLSCSISCGCSPSEHLPLQHNGDTTFTFYMIIILRCIGAISFGPSLSLADSVVYDVLGKEHSLFWGQQRLFGTVAWACSAGLVGLVIDVFASFRVAFYTFIVMCTTSAMVSIFWIPNYVHKPTSGDEKQLSFFASLRIILASSIFWMNCSVAIASGMLLGVTYVPYLHFLSVLGAPKTLYGAVAIVCSILEIPCLFFAGSLVTRLGEITCFLLMFIAYTVRYIIVAFLTAPLVWLALLSDLVHVFCFALYFSAATRIAALTAPPGTSATVQAILHTSYLGIGMGFGILLSNLVYERVGALAAFLSFSAFAAFNFFVLLLLYFAYFRKVIARLRQLHQNEQNTRAPDPVTSAADGKEDNPAVAVPLVSSSCK